MARIPDEQIERLKEEVDGSLVRIMEPSGNAPLRASFTNSRGAPVDAFTGKPIQPPPGLTRAERLDYVRSRSHIELDP